MPEGGRKAPVVVYAHGGAGFREDDRARVAMFRRNGFATISFDSYVMNGFDDWNFVSRQVANSGKQSMIWGVFKGAVAYAAEERPLGHSKRLSLWCIERRQGRVARRVGNGNGQYPGHHR